MDTVYVVYEWMQGHGICNIIGVFTSENLAIECADSSNYGVNVIAVRTNEKMSLGFQEDTYRMVYSVEG